MNIRDMTSGIRGNEEKGYHIREKRRGLDIRVERRLFKGES
jgi:hypothetical protein